MKIRLLLLWLLLASMTLPLALPVSADLSADGRIVVVIDPGHGGIDGGTDTGTHTEKEYCLSLAGVIEAELAADGRFDVYMTRSDDTAVSLLDRALLAKDVHADLLLSVHFNSNPEDYPNGANAYVSLIEKCSAAALSDKILDAISATVPIRRGKTQTYADTGDALGVYYWDSERQWDMPGASYLGQKSDYYSMNTWSSKFGIPSIIVEHGYLSNAGDRAVANDPVELAAMGKAEAQAIIAYFTDHEHVFGEVVTDMPSNCTLTGSASRHCTICGCKTDVTALAPAPDAHFWRTIEETPATEWTDGSVTRVCQIEYNLAKKGYDCEAVPVTEIRPAGEPAETIQEPVIITETETAAESETQTEAIIESETERDTETETAAESEIGTDRPDGEETVTRRSIVSMLKNPAAAIVLGIIAVQLILVVFFLAARKRPK